MHVTWKFMVIACVGCIAVSGCTYTAYGKGHIAFEAKSEGNGQSWLTCTQASGGTCILDVTADDRRAKKVYRVTSGHKVHIIVPSGGIEICGHASDDPSAKCTPVHLAQNGFVRAEQGTSIAVKAG